MMPLPVGLVKKTYIKPKAKWDSAPGTILLDDSAVTVHKFHRLKVACLCTEYKMLGFTSRGRAHMLSMYFFAAVGGIAGCHDIPSTL